VPNPLQAPWRMAYIVGDKPAGCVFCGVENASDAELRERLVLCRAEHAYVMLNRYPYAAGHLMVIPYGHVGDLAELDDALTAALFVVVRTSLERLRAAVRCEGVNVGLNLGKCAGSSIREHLHVQIVPRWDGDNNFMPVIAGERVLSQALDETWAALRPSFTDLDRR
jgi:ATP adenylyltransferase